MTVINSPSLLPYGVALVGQLTGQGAKDSVPALGDRGSTVLGGHIPLSVQERRRKHCRDRMSLLALVLMGTDLHPTHRPL